VAWNGDVWLVVWQESRGTSTGLDIYGTRVDKTGAVLDPTGIPISAVTGGQTFPAVAWGGSAFLVTWTDRRSGVDDIYGARVSGLGTLLDLTGIPISTAPNGQTASTVTWDGAGYLVAWQDARPVTTTDIYATRVTTAGSVQDPGGVVVTTAAGNQSGPAAAGYGSGSFVVWKDRRNGVDEIFGARVSSTDVTLDPLGVFIAGGPAAKGLPALAFNGTNFLVVWDEAVAGNGRDVFGLRVSTGAVVIDAFEIPVSDEPGDQDFPAVAATTDFFVVWRDRRSLSDYDVYGARVTAAGVPKDFTGIPIAATGREERDAAVAAGPSKWNVAYDGFLSTSDRVYFRTVSSK
jgi:YD repeat-containing protein